MKLNVFVIYIGFIFESVFSLILYISWLVEYCFATPIAATIGFEELMESFRQWFEVVSWE